MLYLAISLLSPFNPADSEMKSALSMRYKCISKLFPFFVSGYVTVSVTKVGNCENVALDSTYNRTPLYHLDCLVLR